MKTITIELLNDDALHLLKQLEQLNLLRLITNKQVEQKPKRQWAGSLSKQTTDKLTKYTEKSRNEWKRNI